MKRTKILVMTTLLVVLTLVISLGPTIVATGKAAKRMKTVNEETASLPASSTFTAAEFARAYANGVIMHHTNIVEESKTDFSEEYVRDDMRSALGSLFASDDEVFEILEGIAEEGNIKSYQKNDLLFLLDAQPVALSFVTVTVIREGSFFELCYEEKTGAVVNMYYIERLYVENEQSVKLMNDITSAAACYFEKTLLLGKDEYFFVPSISQYEFYVAFGIIQKEPVMSEKYTSDTK